MFSYSLHRPYCYTDYLNAIYKETPHTLRTKRVLFRRNDAALTVCTVQID